MNTTWFCQVDRYEDDVSTEMQRVLGQMRSRYGSHGVLWNTYRSGIPSRIPGARLCNRRELHHRSFQAVASSGLVFPRRSQGEGNAISNGNVQSTASPAPRANWGLIMAYAEPGVRCSQNHPALFVLVSTGPLRQLYQNLRCERPGVFGL